MDFNKLKIGRKLYFHPGLFGNDESDEIVELVVLFKYYHKDVKYLVLDDDPGETTEFGWCNDHYSLTKNEAIKKYQDREMQRKKLVKEIYDTECLFNDKIKKLREEFDSNYVTIDKIHGEGERQRLKESLQESIKSLGLSPEYFNYITRSFYPREFSEERRKTLSEIGISEKDNSD